MIGPSPASRDLDSVETYIARDNPDAAAAVVVRIIEAVEILADFPNAGRPGRRAGTREYVIAGTPYVVMYRVYRGNIEVLRVVHFSMRWPTR